MIQATEKSNFTAYIQTEDNRISASNINILHLFKFTNDMDNSVQYAYALKTDVFPRYIAATFVYNATPNVYTGRVNLEAGFWKYEVYEVAFPEGQPSSPTANLAPATEDFQFTNTGSEGRVVGLVTKGKMYVTEEAGAEEVSYLQNGKSVQSITIIDGGAGYTSAPTIQITGGDPITNATATCTISGGAIDTVTITHAGNGFKTTPNIDLVGGGFTTQGQVSISINQTHYIYTG